VQLSETVGLVTGGAGGLGSGVVRRLVEGGGRVSIVDIPGSRGADLASELGSNALFLPTDITDSAAVRAAVGATVAAFGRIDLCVNAAGIISGARLIGRDGQLFPLDLFKRTVEVNLIGTFDMTRQVAEAMARNVPGESGERGLIVNVASIAAFEGQIGQVAYSASKGGIAAMTLPVARELARFGIRVMTVAPGIMDTPMIGGMQEKVRAALAEVHVFPKRLGTPEDFARLVQAIMENTLLNGEVIRLDAAARLP
jgi:3-hydroxyacyl-CoA dehydrogenase / 3-hydroxy-2-methylbutyryl-CoA dehydrogenase